MDIANRPETLNIPKFDRKQQPNLEYLNGFPECSLARRLVQPTTASESGSSTAITPKEREGEPLPKDRERVVNKGNSYALSTKTIPSLTFFERSGISN